MYTVATAPHMSWNDFAHQSTPPNNMPRFDDYNSGKKVYVGRNLDPSTTTDELETLFSKYGRIKAVWVARNPPGFAYVTFEDARDADDACRALDATEFFGKRLKVEVARGPRTARGPPERFYYGESQGRSRSAGRNRRSPSYGSSQEYHSRSCGRDRRDSTKDRYEADKFDSRRNRNDGGREKSDSRRSEYNGDRYDGRERYSRSDNANEALNKRRSEYEDLRDRSDDRATSTHRDRSRSESRRSSRGRRHQKKSRISENINHQCQNRGRSRSD